MKRSRFFDAFPTPKFLDIPFAGVHITDSYLRAVQFGRKGGRIYTEKYTERPVAPGVMTAGQITNVDEMVKMLQILKTDLRLDYVRVSLPEEKAYLFTKKIPEVQNDEVYSVIESKIEESVPLPPAELIFDYALRHHQSGHLDTIVSSAPIAFIETYVDVMQKSGLSLLSLEIESQATVRALLPENHIGVLLIAHFGQEKVGLYVVVDRIVYFTSTITLSGHSGEALALVSGEIKKLCTYWETLKENLGRPEKKISQIVLSGEDIDTEAVSYLVSHNQMPVALGDVWTNAFPATRAPAGMSLSDSLRYAPAVGLALPSDIFI